MGWYLAVLKDYAVFDGRAGRSEYWMFFLFNLLIAIALAVLDAVIGTFDMFGGMGLLGLIYTLAVLLPGIGVTIRRLHDTGRSGWWILIGFIPLVGGIILLVMMVLKGSEGENAYGPPARVAPPS
ncbi:DUF805 domain-containing protein [Algiphilus aromaticivorans]|jgi:uncharacterized membrane protein YhaH (DUF805 family)|uniref:DUF805 domain-containing protein n=1 Tax=Algiphilus aromaticivorans TaxID=382454 RepID=UPI0005C16320|nr:DUF805 domain-containing protein [Algiphilus aromaticivorans]